ncbi:protein croquemort-like [Diorhabda sublineata]|uniref:protein croquemort-like n=1 Tax=Diorhabda sublineata TaxID=1163346 RepID=UPI0024E0C9E7|nr:protein croquemort-like [Diorhabda sublineata]XP_056642710.1 protein croquemort-like [Diorhabda sublineata]XP_056642711.1 protein croquemort-like [Diorhabda sublineata]
MGICRCNCTPKCKKWTTFGFAIAFILLGLFFSVFWTMIFDKILNFELSIYSTNSVSYQMWKETPIPIYISFYLFNWTNSEEVIKNSTIKPIFVECGPYTYYEHHVRDNVTFNDNGTVSFYTRRTWKYLPEKSVGDLTDKITTFNPILATVGDLIKYKHVIVQLGVNFFLEEKRVQLAITKTVDEYIFKGYDDPLLDLVRKLNITAFQIPYGKFGWFVNRNDSAEYDGFYNMIDGADGINNLGIIKNWNYQSRLPYYEGECGIVNGSQGELWYPPHDQQRIKIFSSDLCSSLDLDRSEEFTQFGLKGYKYVGTERNFDNGTNYLESRCFISKDFVGEQYSGVRNVSLCKFRAPALVSYPHFYLADPSYLESIEGLKPEKEKHEMYLSLQPDTGLPLSVRAKIQINLKMERLKHIKLLSNVQTRVMPSFWFSQQVDLTENLATPVKTLLVLPSAGQYTGFSLLGLGAVIAIIGFTVTYRRGWHDSEEEQLLDQNAI